MAEEVNESMAIHGQLRDHTDQITCLKTSLEDPNLLLSGSRDRTINVWQLDRETDSSYRGTVVRKLEGHHHIVEDIDLSTDGQYCLSASWDRTLRLWHLASGEVTKKFHGHTGDVLSCAFSPENRIIISGSRDRTVRLWNTIAENKWTTQDEESHKDWVTCVRFSPQADSNVIVSGGWDKQVKVIDINARKVRFELKGHKTHINTVTVSPDGSLCASGDKSGMAMLWDLNEGKALSHLDAQSQINDLCFSPNRYWLCAATASGVIKIWDLESKLVVAELELNDVDLDDNMAGNSNRRKKTKKQPASCNCICWSQDGRTLFAGYSDSIIRIWQLSETTAHYS